jgi:4'-phosphopantetheinyl transferase
MTELWLVDLERAAPALEALESAEPRLSADDRARTGQIADPRERRDRLAAYVALRVALERVAGRQVRGVAFIRSPGGKPRLPESRVGFSLSHSDGFALVGVTRLGDIGVDLERARSVRVSAHRRRLLEAAGRGLVEAPSSQEDGGQAAQDAFLQAWSRLEAFAKARGRGLARVLADLGVRGDSGRAATPARIEAAARRVVGDAGLKVRDLRLPSGLHGAVALARTQPVPRVRVFPTDGPALARLLAPRRTPRRAR